MSATSRLMRWYSDGVDLRDGSEPAPVDDSLQSQVRSAMECAALASRSATDRLERARRRVEVQVMGFGGVGLAALAGLVAVALVPTLDRGLAIGTASLCAVTALAACVGLGCLAWRGDPSAAAAAAALAGDLAIGKQAKQLSLLAALITEKPATPGGDVVARLVAEVGAAANAARDREASVRGSDRVQGRRHERIVPRQTRVQVTTADGRMLNARIVDVSQSGAALEGNFPGCGVGHRLRLGSRRAHVVRVLPRGLACEFDELIPGDALTPDIVL